MGVKAGGGEPTTHVGMVVDADADGGRGGLVHAETHAAFERVPKAVKRHRPARHTMARRSRQAGAMDPFEWFGAHVEFDQTQLKRYVPTARLFAAYCTTADLRGEPRVGPQEFMRMLKQAVREPLMGMNPEEDDYLPEVHYITRWPIGHIAKGCAFRETGARGLGFDDDWKPGMRPGRRAELKPVYDGSVARFIAEACDRGEGVKCRPVKFAEVYRPWCWRRGLDPVRGAALSRRLKEAGVKGRKTNGYLWLLGVCPRDGAEVELPPELGEF